MNSKNVAAKKDLRLAYTQSNHLAYPSNMERIARFLSSQYTNKNINPNNNPGDKIGDKNGKKGDEAKSKHSDSNNIGTTGAHVRENDIGSRQYRCY